MIHRLRVIEGAPESESQFDLVDDRLMVGRHVTADIPLYNATVNKNHAVLTRTEAGYAIEDWESRSGTFVNGARIGERILLKDGDRIEMGTVKLIYERKFEEE